VVVFRAMGGDAAPSRLNSKDILAARSKNKNPNLKPAGVLGLVVDRATCMLTRS